jgi:hypothetical protein
MKLLLPFKVGDIVRMNYDSPNMVARRIIKISEGCTCANYVDVINNGQKAKRREPHLHFVIVREDVQPNKNGEYRERDCGYLSAYVYRNGECVSVDGPYEKWMSGWHEEGDGWDKIKLVRLAPAGISKLTKPKIQPTTTECDDEE